MYYEMKEKFFKNPISEKEFLKLKVTEVWLRKCYMGAGILSWFGSAATHAISALMNNDNSKGSTIKHYWIVLKVELTDDLKKNLKLIEDHGYVLI
jgi:hypothetical protein